MSYTPNNDLFFTAVYSGVLAGMVAGRGITSAQPANYADLTEVAGAAAKELDTQWGTRPTTELDIKQVQEITHGLWRDRAPELTTQSVLPINYALFANAVIAILEQSKVYFADEMIPVPPEEGSCCLQIIWRPGVDSQGDHVKTWAEVETAITVAQGDITVIVDDSVAPAIVPATADTECFGEVDLTSFSSDSNARITIADGGRLKNIATVKDLVIIAAPTSRIPLRFDRPSFGILICDDGVIANDVGATVAVLEAATPTFVAYLTGTSALDNTVVPAVPMVHINPGNFFGFTAVNGNFGPFRSTMVEGDATTSFTFEHDLSAIFVAQSLMLGGVTEYRTSFAEAAQPAVGNTALRPPIPFAGQMYFDTDLNTAIWWSGSAWVDAAAAYPALDSVFAVRSVADATKLFHLLLAGQTTGTQQTLATKGTVSRTFTLPDISGVGINQETGTEFVYIGGQTTQDNGSGAGIQMQSPTSGRAALRFSQYGNNAGIPGYSGFKSRAAAFPNLAACAVGDSLVRVTGTGVTADGLHIPIGGYMSLDIPAVNGLFAQSISPNWVWQLAKDTINSRRDVWRMVGFTGSLQMAVVGAQVQLKEGANATQGTASLLGGTITIPNTLITANTRIAFSIQEGPAPAGNLQVSARVVGTSFTITSTAILDTCNIAWWLWEPAP